MIWRVRLLASMAASTVFAGVASLEIPARRATSEESWSRRSRILSWFSGVTVTSTSNLNPISDRKAAMFAFSASVVVGSNILRKATSK